MKSYFIFSSRVKRVKLYCIMLSMLAGKVTLATDEYYILPDTVHVEEVVVSGNSINRYQVGAKIEKIEPEQFHLMQDGNLEHMLLRFTPISIKSMGGAFSTIRIRGTSPDHTSIKFGGININSLTLGHSNVSNVPMYLFDELVIQYGSSSVENGSGSIGGAIHLGMNNYWVKGFKGEARITAGSFGEELYGTKLFYGNGKWEGVTRMYYYGKRNNFPFLNTNLRNYVNGELVTEGEDIQRNASVYNKGIIQEVNYRFSNKEFYRLKIWFENDWHDVQQNMQTNYYKPGERDIYEDQHIRIWTDYENKKHSLKYKFGGGYVYDNGIYNNSPDKISTQRLIGEGEGDLDISKINGFKFGARIASVFPDVYAYKEDLIREDWVDGFFSYYHKFFSVLKVTANLRQGYVTGFGSTFAPAVGFDLRMLSGEAYVWKLNGNVSRGYRVPDFNARHWIGGGDPNLKPEDGMNYELGTKYSYCKGFISGSMSVNAFYLDVENWVLWVNDSGWKADNVDNVVSKGVEVQTDWDVNIWKFKFTPGINYTYNPVVRVNVDTVNNKGAKELEGRQLEYVAQHSGVAFLSGRIDGFSFGADVNFTGRQYTNEQDPITQIYKRLPRRYIANAQLGYNYEINEINTLRLSMSVNNIMDVDYESTIGYAMPRRSYKISITYNFN